MRSKMLTSLLIIALAAAMLGGGTMAWFTAKADAPDSTFTAGTVMIEAGGPEGFEGPKFLFPNWNPGDCNDVEFCIENKGTKDAFVRAKLEGIWSPGPLRILVLYTGSTIQLIGVEWDATCRPCTGIGPIATGTAKYTFSSSTVDSKLVLNTPYYFGTTFSGLTQYGGNWLTNGITYPGWCLDNQVTINTNPSYSVDIYDPLCNPDWYNQTDATSPLKTRWQNINFEAISYILNYDYMLRGYISTEVQQAIWMYTNGRYHTDYFVGKADEIVTGATAGLLKIKGIYNPATITLPAGWAWGPGGYAYYQNALSGTYGGATGGKICMKLRVCLDGPTTTNEYQGMQYLVTTYFEAIQSSNEASQALWGWPAPPSAPQPPN